ncbi:MAG TPA: response regulator, partial [Candidatus Baltobacteraceae bacterium]
IVVESTVGGGSTFTFYQPLERTAVALRESLQATGRSEKDGPDAAQLKVRERSEPPKVHAPDDRHSAEAGDRTLLIVEDDPTFANILAGFARERSFKAIVAHTAAEAIELARRFVPDAITLDLGLPDTDGWELLETLRRESATTDIPVHIISGDERGESIAGFGTVAHLQKPVSEETLTAAFDTLLGLARVSARKVLVVEDDMTQLNAMVNLIGSGEMTVTAVTNANDALAALAVEPYDCVVVDLGLPDLAGDQLIERIRTDSATAHLPIIVYTARDLTRDDEARLRKISSAIVVKDGRAPERLLDELRFFLHRVESELTPSRRHVAGDRPESLSGRSVLIVDDDSRNIMALDAALSAYDMNVVSAEGGLEGIEALRNHPEIDIVLMDIMMPEMDGYETIRRIRGDERLREVPIVALTAKAMKGDREACIAAGASEYVSKPVDVDQLVALLRVWLAR